MMDIRKHTAEEFEQMDDEIFEAYIERLGDLCNALGMEICGYMEPFGSEMEMESRLLELADNLKRQNPKMGKKFSGASKHERKIVSNATKAILDCRRVLIQSIKNYMDGGLLKLGKKLKHTDKELDAPHPFNTICLVRYEDESEYICPNADYPHEFDLAVNLDDLSMDNLLKIIALIEENKTTLYTHEESLIMTGHSDYIKNLFRNSGLNFEL